MSHTILAEKQMATGERKLRKREASINNTSSFKSHYFSLNCVTNLKNTTLWFHNVTVHTSITHDYYWFILENNPIVYEI